jgi:hypothetical protein
MTKQEQLITIIVVVLLLSIGWIAFQLVSPDQNAQDLDGFRYWFWHFRSLDLIAQLALVFAGALAISALLPSEDNNV